MANEFKVLKSGMHEFPVICLFQGRTRAEPGSIYHFAESMDLFSLENLAPNLYEYVFDRAELRRAIDRGLLDSEIKKLSKEFNSRVAVLDVVLDEALTDFDLVLEQSTEVIPNSALNSFEEYLGETLGFNVRANEVDFREDELFGSNIFRNLVYARLRVRPHFIINNNVDLAERLHANFSKDRYVSSQIPVFIITAIYAASATYMAEK